MSKFREISEIKEQFQNKLETSNQFNISKGVLSHFSDFINEHKSTLYALIGASVMNFAINSLQPVMAAPVPTEISQSYKSDYSELNLSQQVAEFNKNIDLGNNVQQLKAFSTKGVDLDSETIVNITQLKEGESLDVKNPFWENTVLEVKNTTGSTFGLKNDQTGSFLDFIDAGLEHQVTPDNAHVLVDTSSHRLSLDFNELNRFLDRFAQATDPVYRMDITKFMIYHEAAHASARQSYNINPESAREIEISGSELHSDIAALTLIGVQTKSLDRFNAVVDIMIKCRLLTSLEDSNHNTTYGLIELKKAINENPELLNMKQSVVSEFAYTVTKKMIDKNFDNDPEVIKFKSGLSTDKDDILNDMVEGNKTTAINYYAGKTLNRGLEGVKMDEYKANNPERRLKSLSYRIAEGLKNHADYMDVTSITYMNKSENKITKDADDFNQYSSATISKLTYNVNTNPILDAQTIAMFKSKVRSDELEYDYSKIIEIAKGLKESHHNEQLSQKIGIKNNKLSS